VVGAETFSGGLALRAAGYVIENGASKGGPMSILVRHAMTESPQTAGPTMNAADAAAMMKQFDTGVIPVAEEGRLVGLVTDRDLVLRVLAERKDPLDVRLEDIATTVPVTVTPDTKLSEARSMMAEHRIRRLPVVKAGALVGILSLGDVALADASERAVGETLEEISESTSTADVSNYPPRGTPERVQRARRDERG
jgi:CBS domain-containing protein